MEHYRCYRLYMPKTQAKRTFSTVKFFPTPMKMPHLSSTDAALQAAKDLTDALCNPHPAAPFFTLSDATHKAIEQLATIFHRALPRVSETKPVKPTNAPRVMKIQPPSIPVKPPQRHRYNTCSNKSINLSAAALKPRTPDLPL
jgi:hypothetical protein